MTLRKKTAWILGLTMLGLLVAVQLASQHFLVGGFLELEQRESATNVARASDAVESELHYVVNKAADWAVWDDTYNFIETLNESYHASNLSDASTKTLQMNVLIYVHGSGRTVFSKAYDLVHDRAIPVPATLLDWIEKSGNLLRHSGPQDVHSGIAILPEGVLLLVAHPILPSLGEGAIRGTLVMGRFLDETILARIRETTHLTIDLEPITGAELPEKYRAAEPILRGEAKSISVALDETTIFGFGVVNDIFGVPKLVLRVETPRDIYRAGLKAQRYFLLCVLLVGVVFFLAIGALLEGGVLSRIFRLEREVWAVEQARSGEGVNNRVSVHGQDEIGKLGRAINSMLGRIDASRCEVEESESRFRILADTAPVFIWMSGPDGKRNYFNRGWLAFRGRRIDQETADGWMQGVHPEDLAVCLAAWGNALAQCRECRIEYRLRCSDGSYRWMRDFGIPRMDKAGEFAGFVGVCADITEQREVRETLLHAKEAAESANRMKSEFLASMSHEIRTPLNGLLGLADILQETDLDEEQGNYVRLLRQSGQTLLTILSDILDLSKIEAGRFVIEAKPFELVGALEECAAVWGPRAESKGLQFSFSKHLDSITTVIGDKLRLAQIVDNFLSNAVKFTDRGSITLSLQAKDSPGGKIHVEIAVKDTGRGIAPEKTGLLFQKFTQIDASVTKGLGGTGLGLAISKQLAEMMGGKAGYRPGENGGSEFWIDLSFDVFHRQPSMTSLGELRPDSGLAHGMKVLVVEDNPVSQKVAQAMLHKLGCEVQVASGGKQALAMVQREVFDVVFMDCQMPEMDGYETTAAIRKLEGPAAQLPIVALTANAMPGDREICLQAGMDEYLAKPATIESLRSMLHRLKGMPKQAARVRP